MAGKACVGKECPPPPQHSASLVQCWRSGAQGKRFPLDCGTTVTQTQSQRSSSKSEIIMWMNKQINEQTSILAVTTCTLTKEISNSCAASPWKLKEFSKKLGSRVVRSCPWASGVSWVSEDVCPLKMLLLLSIIVQTFCWLLWKISKVRLVLQRSSKQFCGVVFVKVLLLSRFETYEFQKFLSLPLH